MSEAATPAEFKIPDGIGLIQIPLKILRLFEEALRVLPGSVASILNQDQLVALRVVYMDVLSEGRITREHIELGERIRIAMLRLGYDVDAWTDDARILRDVVDAMDLAGYSIDVCSSLAFSDVIAVLESRVETLDRLKARGLKKASPEIRKKAGKLPGRPPERALVGSDIVRIRGKQSRKAFCRIHCGDEISPRTLARAEKNLGVDSNSRSVIRRAMKSKKKQQKNLGQ